MTADPLGYVDGPSMYLFAGYSPVNYGDPMGLEGADVRGRQRDLRSIGVDPLEQDKKQAEELKKALANPKVQGSLQIVGGCSEAALGALALGSGVGTLPGAVAVAHGSDMCGAGVRTLVSGEVQETFTSQGAEWLAENGFGASPETTEYVGYLTDLGFSTFSGLASARALAGLGRGAAAAGRAARPTLGQVRALRGLGVSRAARRAFFEGKPVRVELPTQGGKPTVGYRQLRGQRLRATIGTVENRTGGGLKAFTDFRGSARQLGRELGVRELELGGALVVNPKIEAMLIRQGFKRGMIELPTGEGPSPVSGYKKVFQLDR